MRTRRCWEYKTVKISAKGWFVGGIIDTVEFDKLLNQLGAEGWELVSVLATAQGYGQSREIAAVFKRQMEAKADASEIRPSEGRFHAR